MDTMDNHISIDLEDLQINYHNYGQFYRAKTVPALPAVSGISSSQQLLDMLAKLILDDQATAAVYYAAGPIFVELIARLVEQSGLEQQHLEASMVEGSLVLRAMCQVVPFTNEFLLIVEQFVQKRAFFDTLECDVDTVAQDNLHSILLAFYRLIAVDRERFKRFVRPAVLHSILKSDRSTAINRHLAIELLFSVLQLAESVRAELSAIHLSGSSLRGYYEGDADVDYHMLALLEAQRRSNFARLPAVSAAGKGPKMDIRPDDLSQGIVSVCGILMPTFGSGNRSGVRQATAVVPIQKSLDALAALAQNVRRSQPTMLVGEAGTGKTFLVNELAKTLQTDGGRSIIKIHLNDQTDAKILLGAYTSGDQPGSFKWKNGVLTTAVKEGRWVLIEDIDKAPTEVLSILLTLLEKQELTIPSRGEVVRAANGFQLIATVRLAHGADKSARIGEMIGLRLWQVVHLEPLASADLRAILQHKYPAVTPFLDQFVRVFHVVTEMYSSRRFVAMNKASQPRAVSVRDFVKFCGRVDKLLQNSGVCGGTSGTRSQMVPVEVYDSVFQEAADCFTSSVVERAPLEMLISSIGQQLEIPTSRIQVYLDREVPKFEDFGDVLRIGRAVLRKESGRGAGRASGAGAANATSFAKTGHSLKLMEQIGVAVSMCEPVLLVGETGTGKTTVVQQVARSLHKKLTVINVSQQTEVGDLLGGYKPVNTKTVAVPIQESFEELFGRTFSVKKNAKFVALLSKCFNRGQWKNVVRLWQEAHRMSVDHLARAAAGAAEVAGAADAADSDAAAPAKRRRLTHDDRSRLVQHWDNFKSTVDNFERQATALDSAFAFRFVEGSLVKAVRNGDWLLLDEINLASAETLESIADLLSADAEQRSVLLSESGDVESVRADRGFRIFACMNPSTDVGKKDLPASIRSRFTELYVHSPDRDMADLLMIVDKYIGRYAVGDEWCGHDVVQLYLEAKRMAAAHRIVDGANQRPHFSIRTLTRTLVYVCDIVAIYGLRRALYEGFCMSFLTLLDAPSEALLEPLIAEHTVARLKNANSVMRQVPADPSTPDRQYVQFRHYWMRQGPAAVQPQPQYIMTPFVTKNLTNLVRATSGRRFPVLVQGPTSSGKTSMVRYLAHVTGHRFVRINNHEHTDLAEYLGTYVGDDEGRLVFKEGVLVDALRHGHWIVLDELNLAPTDVLEALNRLLDDNRELFIPETQEVVRPHPDFMLFATQNPPGLYGGRKVLSRAFRNRFLELHFDDIPQDELETILRERCQIAPSYAAKIVEVYRQLSVARQSTRFMEQGNSFATLRDLFRWAQRDAVGYDQLAANGYMLLAERVRRADEKRVVKQVIEKVMKVALDMDAWYASAEDAALLAAPSGVVWTKAMRRLSVLVAQALQYHEPVLLVGETGCGKTTVCQLLADRCSKALVVLNAHQNTETGDILGAQRPLRNRFELQADAAGKMRAVLAACGSDVDPDADYDAICARFNGLSNFGDAAPEIVDAARVAQRAAAVLFEWNDGPLVRAMKSGDFFLLDEISLADDSVLERLNSVLEPERGLLLAEKGTDNAAVTAAEGFEFLATMNPGGDYGKKELSPALRNRFTEIWVPSMDDFADVRQIVAAKLHADLASFTDALVQFSEWFGKRFGAGDASSGVISLRDILAWVQFVNRSYSSTHNAAASFLHGASMVFVDALGTNNTAFLAESEAKLAQIRQECIQVLSELVHVDLDQFYTVPFEVELSADKLRCGLYEIPRATISDGDNRPQTEIKFNLRAPTTAANAMRVLRAMQVHKPILLEGSPGVGKTSLVSALAAATGNALTRINLSEQTDLIDLFGSDAPAEGGDTGEFVWKDAPFLRAMQRGEWVLLDEMNLASQSVLEGLNACLDHRGEAYIPELDKSFTCHPNFVVFAAQNPQYQGGGRKGLPKSFVNRFSVVYVEMLKFEDLQLIAHHLYPEIDPDVCSKLITFISRLEQAIVIDRAWGSQGAPWEFNLRDTLRWLELFESRSRTLECSPADFVHMIVVQRFRAPRDRAAALDLFREVFGTDGRTSSTFTVGRDFVQAGDELLKRTDLVQHTSQDQTLVPLHAMAQFQSTVATCVKLNWPLILTGPTGAGKTSLIRYMGGVLGAEVSEFSMNSEVDSMDILGGYEQVDVGRLIAEFFGRMKVAVRELVAVNLQTAHAQDDTVADALDVLSLLESAHPDAETFAVLKSRLAKLARVIGTDAAVVQLQTDAETLAERISRSGSVKFEWFDGMLVQAAEQGKWLVLDNANLCSPSVLDRLNSLLEPHGKLIVNECSAADGQPRIITPHPNFRLFLTVDPKYGELSRAMRNRGIEMFMDDLESAASGFDRDVLALPAVKPEELETDLSLLTVAEPAARAVPLCTAPASSDSSLRNYFMVSDVIARAGTTDPAALSSVLVATLTFVSGAGLEQWLHSIQASSEFDHATESLATEIWERYTFLHTTGLLNSLQKVYRRAEVTQQFADVDYVAYQFLNPVLNAWVAPLSAGSTLSSDAFAFFRTAFGSMDAAAALRTLQERSQHGKLSDLTFIEKSAAVAGGRALKDAPKWPLYALLQHAQRFLEDSLVLEADSDTFLHDNSTLKELLELQGLWQNFLASCRVKDESKLRVFQTAFEAWIAKNGVRFTQSGAFDAFVNAAASLSSDLQLTSGWSVQRIWEHFRAQYPVSAAGWAHREALAALSADFDTVAAQQFAENHQLIGDLRTMIVELYADNLAADQSGFEAVHESLARGVRELAALSDRFLNRRENRFQAQFSAVVSFIDASASWTAPPSDSEYLQLYLLGNRSTETLALAGTGAGTGAAVFKPYPRVFDSLWSDPEGGQVRAVFSQDLADGVLDAAHGLGSVNGFQLKQSVADLTALGAALFRHSGAVLADQVAVFKRLLADWFVELCVAHVDPVSLDAVKAQLDAGAGPADVAAALRHGATAEFCAVAEQFLLPALYVARDADAGCEALGKAWIRFTAGCIQLFVPSSPLDPATAEYVAADLDRSRTEGEQAFGAALHQFAAVFNVKLAPSDGAAPDPVRDGTVPRVYRPDEPCDELFDVWNTFMESAIGSPAVQRLLDTAAEFGATAAQQIDVFQKNSTQFLQRLRSGYRRYADLNDILQGFVYGLKFGFAVLRLAQEEAAKQLPITATWCVDFAALSSPSATATLFQEVQKLCKQQAADQVVAEKILVFFMKSYAVHAPAARRHELAQVLETAFQALYYRWSLRRMASEQEQLQSASLYRHHDDGDGSDEDFKQLFPDFDDVMEMPSGGSETAGLSEARFEEAYSEIAQTYIGIFSGADAAPFSGLVHDGAELHTAMRAFCTQLQRGTIDADLLTVAVAAVARAVGTFAGSTAAVDFYRGHSLTETRRCVEIMERIQGFSHGLLQQWPEHATLQNILRSATDALEYPTATPLARLLAKVEQIYTFVAEWEKYAHAKVSFKTEFDLLTQLIISWRKLELASWQHLFDQERRVLQQAAGKWWFYLFETVMVPVLNGENWSRPDAVRLLEALNVFLSQTSHGEFPFRMALLRAFRDHLRFLDRAPEAAHMLANVVTYYEQFEPAVRDHVARGAKALEKSVNDVILLASWKDVNIDALKQSARRSHQSLYKVVRKYRALLAEPVSPLIEAGVAGGANGTVAVKLPPFTCAPGVVAEVSAIADTAMAVFPPNRNIAMMDRNMATYVTAFAADSVADVYQFAKELLADMDALKQETPATATDDNKAQVAALKTQKRKLLSDTLKSARAMGLRTAVTADVAKAQHSINAVLASCSSFDASLLQGTDVHYFRVLDLMPRLRAAVSSCAEDVPAADAQKGLAVVENLLHGLTTSRAKLVRFASGSAALASLWNSVAYLCGADRLLARSEYAAAHLRRDRLAHVVHWMPRLSAHYVEVVAAAQQLAGAAISAQLFLEAGQKADQFGVRLAELAVPELRTVEEAALCGEMDEFLHQLVADLQAWATAHPAGRFIAVSFTNWIRSNTDLSADVAADAEHDDDAAKLEDAESSFRNLTTSIVVAVQKVVELQRNMQIDPDEDPRWLAANQDKLAQYVQLVSVKRVVARIEKCLAVARSMEHDTSSSRVVAAYAYAVTPFLKHYIDLVAAVMAKARASYANTCHGTFILASCLHTLASQGFCAPQEPQDQQQSDQMHDGTGVGDGEGAANSKDDEHQDDLDDVAQAANEDQKEKDDADDDNDDAIDVEGDMAGELEDAPGADDDEGDDDADDQDDEDLDEEIDDIDDLDPNAIDEKMWDEEAKDDKKEKEADKMPENSKADDDLQAKEDENDAAEKDDAPADDAQEQAEEDDDADQEEDVGEQEDDVTNKEENQLDANTEEADALELPEEMNLDDGEDGEDGEEEEAADVDMAQDEPLDEQDEQDDGGEAPEDAAENGEDADEDADAEPAEDAENAETTENAEDAEDPENADTKPGDTDDEADRELDQDPDQDPETQDNATKQADLEGLDGVEDGMDDAEMDTEAATRQQMGEKGEGADAGAADEQDNVGASGAAPQQEHQEDADAAQNNDNARDQAKESLKQLGDSLKEFHRRRQEILEAEQDLAEQSAAERPDEFQHLDGENTEQETQALGAANKDQVKSIDDEMAIDDDEDQEPENSDEPVVKEEPVDDDVAGADDVDHAEETAQEQDADDEATKQSKTAVMSTKREPGADHDILRQTDDDPMDVDDDAGLIKPEELTVDMEIPPRDLEEARELWRQSDIGTQDLAAHLCEQLRLILEPTLATKLRGDYKTGKRLNMKRIIPYIASQFRKDKIWLRRTKPSKRQYQIMIAVDDSKSMAESNAVKLAFDSIALVSKALTQLESGGLSIVKFGEDARVVHPFDRPFTAETGAKVFQWFDFKQTKTDIKKLCSSSIAMFDAASAGSSDLWQLEIIISDGVCEDHETIQRLVRRAREEKIMLVFVIIDGINSSESILEMSQISYVPDENGKMVLHVDKYLDTFPFEFYVVVHDVNELPEMLSVILRQYFSELASV